MSPRGLYHGFIYDLDNWVECTLHKSADDTTLGVDNIPGGYAATPRDLNRLEILANRNPIRVNTGQCQTLYKGRNNLRHSSTYWGPKS